MVQGRPGRPPLAAKREQFGRLIARRVGSTEASRIVGIRRPGNAGDAAVAPPPRFSGGGKWERCTATWAAGLRSG
jgi:hypothetical protein